MSKSVWHCRPDLPSREEGGPMTPSKTDLEELLRSATPLPWRVEVDKPMTPPVDGATLRLYGDRVPFRSTVDARLAAEAVNALPALLAERKRLREALEEIRRVQGKVCDQFEICHHRACESSFSSWAIADTTLRSLLAEQEATDEQR